jgi:hypothetical protein
MKMNFGINSSNNSEEEVRHTADADFESAFRTGYWRAIISWLTGSDNRLTPFDEVKERYEFKGQHSLGMQTVPLDRVTGSVGRYHDFDRAFLPRQTRTRGRWVSVDEAHLKDISLPAIELYKVGSDYFVKDGNHRVSVARQHGQKFIDAEVIEVDVSKLSGKELDPMERILWEERKNFYKVSRLNELIPNASVELTIPGGYEKLLDHIGVHRWFMGEQQQKEVSWEDAVVSWYKIVYMPLIKIIRENNVLKDFPERREADLYLWIIEHLWYLRQAYSRGVSLDEATNSFIKAYSKRPLNWLLKYFSRAAEFIAGEKKESDLEEENPHDE